MKEIKEYWQVANSNKSKFMRKKMRKILRARFFRDDAGHKQGEFKEWHSNGQLRTHMFYKNSNMEGLCKTYHENGKICEEGFYKDNRGHGEFIVKNKEGNITEHSIYVHSTLMERIDTLTPEDKLFLSLKYGVPMLGDIND